MMNNPYAPPQAAPAAPAGPVTPGARQPWEVGEVIRTSWELYKPQWVVVTFGSLAAQVVASMPGQIPNVLVATRAVEPGSGAALALQLAFGFVGYVVGIFFSVGILRIALAVARGQEATFGMLVQGGA